MKTTRRSLLLGLLGLPWLARPEIDEPSVAQHLVNTSPFDAVFVGLHEPEQAGAVAMDARRKVFYENPQMSFRKGLESYEPGTHECHE